MIYIDRDKVEIPAILISKRTTEEFKQMETFFLASRKKKQANYEFKHLIYSNNEVHKGLSQLFHNKCAYCESILSEDSDIDHFRPKIRAMQMDGSIDLNHYWWLAYDWKNLYPTCISCSRFKSTRFPINGKRLKYDIETIENALLIDPCKKNDFEEQHIQFFSPYNFGVLKPISEKGKITIQVLNLNRADLVENRK